MGGSTSSVWQVRKLTSGSDKGLFHSHSYYDIPVFDDSGRWLVGYRVHFTGRTPGLTDRVEVGVVDTESSEGWTTIGQSSAWSWQQGPMAQFVPGSRRVVWNDRDENGFCAQSYDLESRERRRLPNPIYAIDPNAEFSLTVSFDRLGKLRPGYGYAVDGTKSRLARRPKGDGLWRMDLQTGEIQLILSLRRAARLLSRYFGKRFFVRSIFDRYQFWFNHVKLSPSGRRFTVKLRYREADFSRGWDDRKGVSLTGDVNGENLRVLADATSHVIWENEDQLYFWRRNGVYMYRDGAIGGEKLFQMAPELIKQNVHMRKLQEGNSLYVFDTPYRAEIDLNIWRLGSNEYESIAKFTGHEPIRGEFRCDLHPNPSSDGNKVVVTSMQDGGRQIYLLSKTR